MTYKELYDKALWDLEHDKITLGEFDDMIEPLNKEIPKEEQKDGDLISRQAVLDIISDVMPIYSDNYHYILEQRVKDLPSAEKTAEWLHTFDDYNDWLECSECGYGAEGEVKFGEETNYCPNCGADMRKEKIK